MSPEQFQTAKLSSLAVLTGISSPRWSRYIRGKSSFRETTLTRAARQLNMKPSELLEAIHQRREGLMRA